MKLLKISFCNDCLYFDDEDYLCQNPEVEGGNSEGKYVPLGEIPWWCPLEDAPITKDSTGRK